MGPAHAVHGPRVGLAKGREQVLILEAAYRVV